MNKELGEKQKRIRISLGLVLPLIYPVIGCFMMGLLVIPLGQNKYKTLLSVIFVAAGIALIAYIFRQIFYSGIDLHENGFVVKGALKTRVFMRDNIKVIHWDRPGQFAGTNRMMVRKTNGFAEVMLTSGEMVKIPDSAYKNLPDELGSWQTDHKIPFDF